MIYFVEDDANIGKLVCYALNKEGYDVKNFNLPSEFWAQMESSLPDLILLDIMLPEEDGLQILSKLQSSAIFKDIPVIIITAKDSEFDTVTGLDMGADDYISKPFGMTELTARIRAVLRRYEKGSHVEEYRIGELYVNPRKHIIQVSGENVALSHKEFLLLKMLLEAQGDVIERETLLKSIWGEYYEESRTLDVHIRKLRVKLKGAGNMIHTVRNIGYQMGGNGHE